MKRSISKTKIILTILLLVNLLVSMHMGISVMLTHSAQNPDDFMMRYRESKYVLNRINTYDVVRGIEPVREDIGEVWGYPPWGMAMGILTNFTFLPESIARLAFLIAYVCFFLFMLVSVYSWCSEKSRRQYRAILVLATAAMPAWGWALTWLNFGAILGGMLVWSVLLSERHEVTAGFLLGITATKPQLALPFFLAYLLRRKYKVFLIGCVIPIFFWVICSVLVSVDPISLLLQSVGLTGSLRGDLGGWLRNFGIPISSGLYQLLCAGGAIILAFYFWYRLRKHNNHNALFFFSVPAVLSGIWTYGQPPDRIVLLILLFCYVLIFADGRYRISWKKTIIVILAFGIIMDPDVFMIILRCFYPFGVHVRYAIKVAKYVLLLAGLYFVTGCPWPAEVDEISHNI